MKKGGIIVYPTETIYGLGGNALRVDVIEKIYKIKMRNLSNPISILIKDIDMLNYMVEDIPEIAMKLINSFWPGPLTIVFKASDIVPKILTGNTGNIGVRISSNNIVNNILKEFNLPITSTSANIAGMEVLEYPCDILKYIDKDIDLIIDGGKVYDKIPSTVIDITSCEIIREGRISKGMIKSILGRVIN